MQVRALLQCGSDVFRIDGSTALNFQTLDIQSVLFRNLSPTLSEFTAVHHQNLFSWGEQVVYCSLHAPSAAARQGQNRL
jgi:hypothetical protein